MSRRIGVLVLGLALCLETAAASAQEPCGVPAGAGPRIEAATPVVALSGGATVCRCGAFPDPAALAGLRLDGRPVEASVDAFGRVATVRLPPGLEPGLHLLSGTPEAGYGPEDRAEIRLIDVRAKRCEHFFSCGKHRRVCLTVEGSEEPVSLRVRNRNPELVALLGGSIYEVETTGGPRNRVVLEGRATGAPGHWTLDIDPAGPACPCAVGSEEGIPPERVAELEACLQAAVAEIEAWFDGRARELAARAERGALSRGEVVALIDELERRFLRVLATPDLAALRAWVEDELGREREVWRRAPGTADRLAVPPRPGLALVRYSLTTAQQEAATPRDLDALIKWVGAFFRDLNEVSKNLEVDLCVRFDPTEDSDPDREGLLWLYPKRYPLGKRTANPDAVVPRLTRGIYCLLVTEPELWDDEFTAQAASGSCRQGTRSFYLTRPKSEEADEVKIDWAEGEADLVRELNRYFTCNPKTQACYKRPLTAPFKCDRRPK